MKYRKLLWAPDEFWLLGKEEKSKICNGIGPRGFGWMIPNTIWGLDIAEVGDIHDYMYHIGSSLSHKKRADSIFLNNMVRVIEHKTEWNWLRKLRCHRAQKYYNAVYHLGGPAFWANKVS